MSFAFPPRPGVGTAQPRNYVSPEGEYTLFVDPAERHGRGGASYRLSRNGVEVWSGEKPYSLRQVVVTNAGHAAGMAYRTVGDDSKDGAERYLHVVILNEAGRELLNEVRQRHRAPYAEGPTLPEVEQVIGDVENDRIVIRVQTRKSEWWAYRLSTGEVLAHTDSQALAPKIDNLRSVISVQPLPHTPLFVVHWYTEDRGKDTGGAFALVDLEAGPVWSFEATGDYAEVGYGWRYGGPFWHFGKNPVVSTGAHGCFDIRLFKDRRIVSFWAHWEKAGNWAVTELGRISVPDRVNDKGTTYPGAGPLTYLGELELVAPEQDTHLRELRDFTFDRQGRIYVDNRVALVSLAQDGRVLAERGLPSTTLWDLGRHWTEVPLHADDRYVEIRKDGEDQ